jgi:hypothetical protein
MNKPEKQEKEQIKKTPIPFPPEKRSFDTHEAAIYLKESESALRKKRMRGTLAGEPPNPKFIKTGKRSVRYLREDLNAYLDQFLKHDHTHKDGLKYL